MKRIRGMTGIETLVWIAVFTSAMLAITQSALYFYRTNSYTIQQASAVTSAQRGLDQTIRTIREATYASNGAYPIVSLAGSDLIFYADVDSDTEIERVHYYVTGTSLYVGTLNPSGNPAAYTGVESVSEISEYVRNVALGITPFTFFDEDGVQITNFSRIGDVRFITVNLVVNIDPNKLPEQLTLRSSAALRNL